MKCYQSTLNDLYRSKIYDNCILISLEDYFKSSIMIQGLVLGHQRSTLNSIFNLSYEQLLL